MILKELLAGISIQNIIGTLPEEVRDIHVDSRLAEEQDLFVAIKGTSVDGHNFLNKAKAKVAIVEVLPEEAASDKVFIQVENSRLAWAKVTANYYGNPAEDLTIVGVTGTNGKSSVVTILYQMMQNLGYKSGLISTIVYRIGNEERVSTHTTPDAKDLQALFRDMVDAGVSHCFMEVSSHALSQHRTLGIPFRAAIFTNITRDHLDYHGTFKNYIYAKKILFDQLSTDAVALINADDKNSKVIVQNSAARVRTFSCRQMADYKTKVLSNTLEGLELEMGGASVWFSLMGHFNAYNLVAAYAVGIELGLEQDEVLQALSLVRGIPGRMEIIRNPDYPLTGIVDYSHTPDSLENVLKTIRSINEAGDGRRVITVVGAGGDRDKGKRPQMGQIAASLSDKTILTSDNPRSESPEQIIEEMYEGISADLKRKVLKITSRREAIRTAVQLSESADILLVAGKGHETYQEIAGVKHPFDDREVLREALEEKVI